MGEWEMPLNSHLGTAYFEYTALIVLVELFPEKYGELIRKDKPDLQDADKSLGVEVTRAIEGNYGEIEGLTSEAFYGNEAYKAKATRQIEKLGGSFDEFGMLWPTGHDNFDAIYREFDRKLQKLNSGNYAQICHNELFIHSDIYAIDSMLKQALKLMIEKQRDFSIKFELIYVFVPGAIYILDLRNESYKTKKLDTTWQSKKACKARERAECNG